MAGHEVEGPELTHASQGVRVAPAMLASRASSALVGVDGEDVAPAHGLAVDHRIAGGA